MNNLLSKLIVTGILCIPIGAVDGGITLFQVLTIFLLVHLVQRTRVFKVEKKESLNEGQEANNGN